MKFKILTMAAVCLLPCAMTRADDTMLNIPSFKSLAHIATDSVNIDLGPVLLHLAGSFLDSKDPDDASTKRILGGLKSIQVRSYEFATDFAYPSAEIDAMRRQLSSPRWTQLVQVHNRKDSEDVDIYVAIENDQPKGFALISSEPRKFTVINIVGSIDMADLPALEEHLHIPKTAFSPVAKL